MPFFRWTLLSILVTPSFLSAAGRPAKPPAASKPATFTAATYNINFGNANLPTVVSDIRKADADIVALQETNRASQRYLSAKLAKQYPYRSFYTDRRSAAGGLGFLSKVPLKKVTYLPRKAGWFGAYLATVRLGGKDIRLASVHLTPSVPREGESLIFFLGRWNKEEKLRIKELDVILPKLSVTKANDGKKTTGKPPATATPATSTSKPDNKNPPSCGETIPTLILGDFNSLPGSAVAQYMTKKGYLESYQTVTPANQRKATWQWRVRGIPLRYQLDYIYHCAGFKTLAARIFPNGGSDHNLLIAALHHADDTKKPDDDTPAEPASSKKEKQAETSSNKTQAQ